MSEPQVGRTRPEPPNRGATPWLRLDLEGEIPVFLQLYRQLVGAILTGDLAAGTVLPSARQLASDLGVHYHTVNKAYAQLRRDSFAVMNRRKQLFVRLPKTPGPGYVGEWSDRQETLLHEALGRGVRPDELRRRVEVIFRRLGGPRFGGAGE